ncbi:hypothetical protein AB0392_17875 [Nonomuraea angiospora]|uniref:hypothetical protein n=1 Tax=Nonomuraea angiospora TaxID=46172 RepID=UPI00344C54E8
MAKTRVQVSRRPDYLTGRSADWRPPPDNRPSGCTICDMAPAARTDLKVVQAMLGHASIVLAADTYVSVLPEVAHQAARETARLVLNAASALGRQLGG